MNGKVSNYEAEAVADRYERAMERLEESYEKRLEKLRDQLEAAWTEGLSASPDACAVADAWVNHQRKPPDGHYIEDTFSSHFIRVLQHLETATRESQLRKVKP